MNKMSLSILKQWMHNIRLNRKLFITHLMLSLLLLTSFTIFSYSKLQKVVENNLKFSALQDFNQAYNYIYYKFGVFRHIAEVIAVDKNLNDILSTNVDEFSDFAQVDAFRNLSNYLASFQDYVDIQRVKLYINSKLLFAHENTNIFSLGDISGTSWYKLLTENKKKIWFFPYEYFKNIENNENEILSIGRNIENQYNYRQNVAILRVDINKQSVENILSQANPTTGSFTVLCDSEGIIVASSKAENNLQSALVPATLKQMANSEQLFSENQNVAGKVFVSSRKLDITDWWMITVIPYTDAINATSSLRDEFMIVVLFMIIFSSLLAFIISNSITKRIYDLIKHMNYIQKEDLDVIISTDDKDEIGDLIRAYNYMLKRISFLLKDQFRVGQMLKTAELKALQSQINPHFLYNTLDTINWLNQKNQITESKNLINNLAKYYKISLNQGKDIVSIAEELEHVRYFIEIQNMRFRNRIALEIDVASDILTSLIPKITLQPLVENAILHGIFEKEDHAGTISISGWKDADSVKLSVKDDGVGIPEAILSQILEGNLKSKEGNSFGVKNINERLKLLFGEKYGLSYWSSVGTGTIVEITIPDIKEKINNI